MSSRIGPTRFTYYLKSEVSVMLPCQLCPTRYIAVLIKNCSKSTSVIKAATIKNTDGTVPQLSSETEVSIVFFCQLVTQQYKSGTV